MLNALSSKLAMCPLVPWRFRHLGGPLNTVLYVPVRRRLLLKRLSQSAFSNRGDVTVVIGTKNRADYRLRNALLSIRGQDHRGAIAPVVVDYDSDRAHSATLRALCEEFGARHVRVDSRPNWNRGHCLNIGIRGSETEFVLTSDTDIIFAPNYVSSIVDALRREPLSVIYSQTLDLPESADPCLRRMAATEAPWDVPSLWPQATARSHGDCNAGICATYTEFFRIVRGYDEYFELWGHEDNDLATRFRYLGLSPRSVRDRTYYLHQWHPKFEGVSQREDFEDTRKRNNRYAEATRGIVRNTLNWGLP